MAENEVMEFAIEEMIPQSAEELLMVRVSEVSQLIPNVEIDDKVYKSLYDLNSLIVTKLEGINQVEIPADGDQTTIYVSQTPDTTAQDTTALDTTAQDTTPQDSSVVTTAPVVPTKQPKKRRWGKYKNGRKTSQEIPIKCLTKRPERPFEEKRFKCGVCEFRAVRRDAVREHMKVHSDIRPYKCKFCAYTTKHKYDLPKHERLHTGERPYVCPLCDHTARSASTLAVHRRSHTGDKPYQCGLCDFRGTYRVEVVDHYKKEHQSGGDIGLKCPHCEFQGRTKFHLETHTKKEHTDTQPLSCPICSYASNTESEMSGHVYSSHGLPKHECTKCDFYCYDALKLKDHVKTHQPGEAAVYKCELCDHGVQHSENDGPEPYRCEKCTFKASKCYELEKHIKLNH